MFRIKSVAICNKGKVRDNNEDNLIFHKQILDEMHDGIEGVWELNLNSSDNPVIYGVFDGMGGHSKGEYASYIAAKVAQEYELNLNNTLNLDLINLSDVCIRANEIICKKIEEEHIITGSTVAMICICGNILYTCNLGDSPIYSFRKDNLFEIYEEHSTRKMHEMLFGKEKIKGKKFPLTQHLGIFSHEMKLSPYQEKIELHSGDQYLLCSDGLTDMVTVDKINSIMSNEADIYQKVKLLETLALDNGGKDNITIIGITIE